MELADQEPNLNQQKMPADPQNQISRRMAGQGIIAALAGKLCLENVACEPGLLSKMKSIPNVFLSLPEIRQNQYTFAHHLHLPYSVRNENETERLQRKPLPLVILFGGNGMGAVRHSDQTSHMAHALNRAGIAALDFPYPAQVSSEVFQKSIISRINDLLTSRELADNHIDRTRIAFAGFSAGGLLATLLATKYFSELQFQPVAALNYYGPVDLRLWFAFHQARAAANRVSDFFRGQRSGPETGFSAGGPIRCDELSRSVIAKVSDNMGGLRPGSLAPFSQDELWFDHQTNPEKYQHAPVLGVFGRNDDNCDAVFQSKLMEKLAGISGISHEFRFYNGPHGVHWDACQESMDWLENRLNRPVIA